MVKTSACTCLQGFFPTTAMPQFDSSFDPRLVSRVCVRTRTPRRWRNEKPQDLTDHGGPEARTAAIGLRLDGAGQETGRHTRSVREMLGKSERV
ncbi:hypothetical protein ZWY2020_052650 [Hordeum vulgare]|nr:hypothetical protein ZWY2020_052650 [Hordeum vulgare]